MKKPAISLALTLLLSTAQMHTTNNTFVPKYEYYPETKKPLFERRDIRRIAVPTSVIASAVAGFALGAGAPRIGVLGAIAASGANAIAICNATRQDRITPWGLASLDLLALLLGYLIGMFVKSSSNTKSNYERV